MVTKTVRMGPFRDHHKHLNPLKTCGFEVFLQTLRSCMTELNHEDVNVRTYKSVCTEVDVDV